MASHNFKPPPDQASPRFGHISVWNGHFQSKCLHPLFVFNQYGDLERCVLRPGNVHSADSWEDVLKPVLARYAADTRPSITRRRFRADAAFAIPALFDLLEAEGWDYAIRIKGNSKLYDQIGWLMKRRPGRPPNHVMRVERVKFEQRDLKYIASSPPPSLMRLPVVPIRS